MQTPGREQGCPSAREAEPGKECELGEAGSAWRRQKPEGGGLLQKFMGI